MSASAVAAAVPGDVVRLRRAAVLVLAFVALAGAVLSFASLYRAAVPTFGPWLAAGFPLTVDALCAGAALAYAAGAKLGRPRSGWRWTAHAAAVGTVALNALAAPDLAHVPWHVAAPVTWSVLVELAGRELLGEWKATHAVPRDRIPARLWWSAPVESARTWLLMARVGLSSHSAARVEVGVHAAAREALRLAVSGPEAASVRRVLERQLRAGSLDPVAVLAAIGWTVGATGATGPVASDMVLRLALTDVLAGRRPSPRRGVSQRPSSPAPTPVVRSDLHGPTWDSAPETASPSQVGPVQAPAVTPAVDRPAQRRAKRSAVVAAPSAWPEGKRERVTAALDQCSGDVGAALELLRAAGAPVGKSLAYEVRKEWSAGRSTESRSVPSPRSADRSAGRSADHPMEGSAVGSVEVSADRSADDLSAETAA